MKSKVVAEDPGGSDQVSFHGVGVPAIQLFSGTHDDYHTPADTVDKIDFEGLARVSDYLKAIATATAIRPPTCSRVPSSSTGM